MIIFMKNDIVAKTVDEYIDSQPKQFIEVLHRLRKDILSAAPKAEEVISYRIPTYKLDGPLVHFAAFKNHCSFIVVNRDIPMELKKELAGFKISGTTIHFTAENPIPSPLVKKIMKLRLTDKKKNALKKK
jgi:uncharacterized protein YdhG (YjbR/CyaY superfamily)